MFEFGSAFGSPLSRRARLSAQAEARDGRGGGGAAVRALRGALRGRGAGRAMAAKDNPCRKFQANIFNKSKCQNCFKPRESHLLNDEDLNQVGPASKSALPPPPPKIHAVLLTPDCRVVAVGPVGIRGVLEVFGGPVGSRGSRRCLVAPWIARGPMDSIGSCERPVALQIAHHTVLRVP